MISICFPADFMTFIFKNPRNSITSAKRSNVQTKQNQHIMADDFHISELVTSAPRCGSGFLGLQNSISRLIPRIQLKKINDMKQTGEYFYCGILTWIKYCLQIQVEWLQLSQIRMIFVLRPCKMLMRYVVIAHHLILFFYNILFYFCI